MEAKQKEFGTEIYLISDEPYRELAFDGIDVPYLTKMSVADNVARQPIIFTDKNTKQLLQWTSQGVAWERGSNIISGFEIFGTTLTIGFKISQSDTDFQRTQTNIYEYTKPNSSNIPTE